MVAVIPFTYPVIRKFSKGLDKMPTKILSSHAWITQTHVDPCMEKRENLIFRDTVQIRVIVKDLKLLAVREIPSGLTGHLQHWTRAFMMLIT